MLSPEQHSEHMQKIMSGLSAIKQSNDINEIHSIADSLMQEEEYEKESETKSSPMDEFKKAARAASIPKENMME